MLWELESLSIDRKNVSQGIIVVQLTEDSKSGYSLIIDPYYSQGNWLSIAEEWRYFDLHGILLFLSWNVFGFIMIGSARWWVHFYKISYIIHAGFGLIITGFTIWLALRAIFYLKIYRIDANTHAVLGIAMLFAIAFLTVSGIVTQYRRNKYRWMSAKIDKARLFHAVFGYLFLLIGVIECVSGMVEYYKEVDPRIMKVLIPLDIIATLVIYVTLEWIYRR